MIELLIELLANRLGVFILGVLFIAAGVYTWQNYRADTARFDAAVGGEGRTVNGTIVRKGQERVRNSYNEGETVTGYYLVEYEHDGELRDAKVYVDSSENAARSEGEGLQVQYHPQDPEFVVTADVERESAVLAMIFTAVLIGLGAVIDLAVLLSFL